MAFTSGTYFTGLTPPADAGLTEAQVQALIDASIAAYATEAYVDDAVEVGINPDTAMITDGDHVQDLTKPDVRMYTGTPRDITLLSSASWLYKEFSYKNLEISGGDVTITCFAGDFFDDLDTTFVLSPGDSIRLKAMTGNIIDRRSAFSKRTDLPASEGGFTLQSDINQAVEPASGLTINSNYNQNLTDKDLRFVCSDADYNVYLLNSPNWINKTYTFKLIGISTHTLTINTDPSDQLDNGLQSIVLSPGDCITLKGQPSNFIDRR